MEHPNYTFQDLTARARRGDVTVLPRLRHEIHEHLVRVARQTLDGGTGRSPMQKQILATARQLARYARPGQEMNRERLAWRVASCLSETMIERLTSSLSSSQTMEETVRL